VLSQRLAGGEAKDPASQLPEEIGYYLLHSQAGAGQQFSLAEFFDRVAAYECEDKPKAIHHVRTVFEILREAVSAGQFAHVMDQLPEEYAPLLTGSSEGKMRIPRQRKQTPSTRGRTNATRPRAAPGASRTAPAVTEELEE